MVAGFTRAPLPDILMGSTSPRPRVEDAQGAVPDYFSTFVGAQARPGVKIISLDFCLGGDDPEDDDS